MTALMERTAYTPEQWREGMTAVYRSGEAMLAEGRRPHIELSEEGDTLTLRQLRFIHGPILDQISEQVWVEKRRFDKYTWKRHIKNLFIPDEYEMVAAPFVRDRKTGEWRPGKGTVPRKKEKSLKSLKNEARSIFIDQVLAHAAVEWGVVFIFKFDEREAVRYVAPRRKVKQQAEEAQPA